MTDDHSPPQTSEPLGEEETVANTRNISSGHDVRMKAIEEARVLLEEARQQIEEVGQRKAVGRSRSIPVSRVNNNSPRNKMNRNSPQNNVGSPPHNMDIEMDRLVESDKILRARLESQAKTLSEWKSQNEVYSSELKELKQQYEIAREKITAYEKRMSENDEQRFKTGEELKERTEEKEKYRLEALGALKTLQVEGGQLKTVREAFELAEKKLAQSDEYIAATELEKKIFMERYEEKLKSLEAEKATLKADCEERYKEKLKRLEAENATLEADCEKLRILIEEHVKRGKELGHEIEAQKDKTAQLDSLVASAESRWLSVSKTNRLLHNKVIEMLGNIRVVCRVRPFSSSEIQRPSHAEDAELIDYQDDGEGIYEGIVVKPADKKQQKFNFDRVFQPDSKQEEVFEEIGPLIQSCMDGYSVCIFAYGQTGSGKTYTMEGGHGNALERGLNYRALELLFRLRDNRREVGETFEFYVTMIEIYNEVIRDLLGSDDDNNDPWNPQKKLEIRKTIKGSSVLGVKEMKVASPEEVAALLDLGNSNRSVGSHSMNHESSRSHSIFCIRIEGRKSDGAAIYAKLHLVDLAGSERISKTDAKGDRLLEAQHINKSLSSLGDVISALVVKKDKEMHVPFRNSKLTYLLQECLGGDSKVMMIVTISPSVYNTSESLSSLNFAKRCRMAELGQTKKQQDSQETVKLKRQINRHSVENKQLLAETQKAATLQEQLQNLQEDYFQQSDAYSKLQLAQKKKRENIRIHASRDCRVTSREREAKNGDSEANSAFRRPLRWFGRARDWGHLHPHFR